MIFTRTQAFLFFFLIFFSDLAYSQCGIIVTRNPASSTICIGATVTINSTASPAGSYTYQWTTSTTSGGIYSNIPGATNSSLAITGTTAGSNYYKLNLISAGCTTTTASALVTTLSSIQPSSYNVTGGGAYCSGGTGVSIGLANSDIGVNYTLKRGTTTIQTIAGTGAALIFNNQTTAGTYTVTGNNGSCTATMSGNAIVSINSNPTAYSMSGGGNYCTGGTGLAVGLTNSQSGVNYQLLLAGSPLGSSVAGTGSAISFGIQTTAGTYTSVATNASTSCTSNMNGTATITIIAYPNVYNVTGGGPYCSGGTGVSIGLDNSDIGVNYTLKRGNTTVQTLAGSGSALTFSNQTTVGTYTISASNGTCISAMNGSPTVLINPNPTVYTITGGGGYCPGGSGAAVGLSDSQSGVNYQLLLAGSPVGSPVAGTGSAISFGLQTATGTYTAEATNATTSCTSTMSGSTTVSIQNPPAIYNVIGGGSYCKNGAGLPVGISNSDIGINYTLKRGTTTVQTLAGTGSAFNFNNQTAAGTYTVTGNNGGCVAAMNGNAVITINPNPVAYNLTGGGSYCPPGVGLPVGLSNSRTGISYQLMDGASPVGTPVAGITGQALNFGNQAVFASYTVIATNASTFCTATMSGTAVVSDATPVAYTLTGGGSYCQNGSGLPVGVSNSDLGISYQLMMGANPIGSSVAGTGSAINFGNQTTAGTYSVIATNNSVFCTDTMNGNIVISIDPLPSAYNVTGGGSYCAGGAGVAVGLDNSDTGINYQLMLGGSPVGSAVAGTGSSISFGNQTAAGTYTVIASNASTSCSISMNGNATVVINSNPTPTITAGGPTTFCSGDSVTLTSSVASSYLWSTGATSQSIVVKLSGNKSVTVTDANGCQGTSASTLVSVSSAPIITASGPTTFCAGGSVTLTSSAASSYLWSNGATTQSIIVSSTQKDSVVVTNAIGCKDTSAATLVTVNPNPATPTITADGTLNFCSGDSVTLTSSIAFSYLWSTGETTRSIVVKFNDIDSVTAIDANGCQATSAPITVLVSSTPTITASGPTTLCSGGSVTLTSSAGSSYLWSNGATTQSIIVSSSERDSVVVTNGIGCKDTSAATIVTVNPNPATPTISAGGATTFCAGDSVTLTSSASSSYLWSTGATSQSIVVKVGGNKSVTISDANGCQNTSAATLITVNSNPSPSITADGPTSFCSGDSVTLTSSAASSYLWSTGATSQSIVVKITENDSVRVTDANGCEGTSAPTLVSVSSTPIITASGPTTFCSGGSVTLTSSSGSSYLWSNGATTQSIVVSSTQKDSVIVTNAIACQDTSAATQVTVNPCNFTWTGSSDTDWNTGSNWDIGFVPDNVDDAVIPSGVPNMPVLTGVAQIGDLTISSGATFTMSNGSTLNIFGNFTNSGTFTDNGGITSFDGSSAQSINGTTNFKNLSISNSAGLTLNNAVNVTGVLRLLQGSITTNDSLTLDLNTGTIAYDVTDAGNISGNLKISKSVLSISNHFVACPVTGTSVNDFNDDTQVINPSTGKSRLFTWNFATQAWSTGITNLNTALNPGTGYSLYFIAGTTLDFTGGYNHGAIFSPITASNANTNKYMLIGNPYPATLDWNAASGWTKTGVNNAIYFWDAQNSRYASYVNGTGSNGGTQYIPSLQAFLVMTDGTGGTASVIPNNLARVTGPNNSLWRGASSNNILRIKASSLGYSDETVLQFSDEATAYFDNNLDAIKMKNPEGSPSLYTSDFQNIYSINTMPLEDRIIPLNLEANFAGLHTLSFEGIESFDKAVSIVLEDKLLNTRTEVKPGLIYEVDVKQDDNSSRFNLRVGDTGAAEAMSIRIGSNEKNILVEFNSSASGNASLKVFNILGQEMASMNNIDAANGLVTVPAAFLKEGIYIVKIILNDKLYTGKVFIK